MYIPTELGGWAVRELLKEMTAGKYKNARRLPPETELADTLKMSRTAIRDALATLEREGYISRRRAIGTIINRHVLGIKVRIDQEMEFLRIVENAGYTPDTAYITSREECADSETADRLRLCPGDAVLTVDRLITADGIPAIYCSDYIDRRRIRSKFTDEDLACPIFDFMANFVGDRGYMDITDIHAVNAEENVARELNIPEGTAVLRLDEVWYDFDGFPVLYAREFYRQGMITHTILRKLLLD